MTVIVTAVYGQSDDLHPQVEQDINVEWLAFTDDPDLVVPAPWTVILTPATRDHPRMAAKVHKMTPDTGHADTIWIDGSMQITSRTFARESLRMRRQGIAVWRHPRRDCVYAEVDACLGDEAQGGKYRPEQLEAQIAAYRAEGHPERFGLYACGTIAWDLSDPAAVALGAAWLAECDRWSSQDQLSLPVVCRRAGVTPGIFPVRQIERSSRRGWLENRWLRIYLHKNQNIESAVDAVID